MNTSAMRIVGLSSILSKESEIGKRLELYTSFEIKTHGTTTNYEGVKHRLTLCGSYLQAHEEIWIVVTSAVRRGQ